MAFSSVLSASLEGLCVEFVQVEVDISNGFPAIYMVGYLSSEVKEASRRVRTAIENSGFEFPERKVVINLSPGTVHKKGTSFDLPIALGLFLALKKLPGDCLDDVLVLGELSLDGALKEIPGVLPVVSQAKKNGVLACILPKGNAVEAALVDGVKIYGVENLCEAVSFLEGKGEELSRQPVTDMEQAAASGNRKALDFADIHGQETMKRAAEVAAAGGHNLLFVGPPGSGKSMVARRIPTILPRPAKEESIEITKIYSVLGLVDPQRPLMAERPFRSVHHTVTRPALIGGGVSPMPGEISLAHGGVLFLDELAEFPKSILELLRVPLEEHCIRISRAGRTFEFPANFILVAAMNPCPCGNYPDPQTCICTPWQVQQYQAHVSQPFLDRIDLCVETPRVEYADLSMGNGQDTSAEIRERVCMAREIQKHRFGAVNFASNATIGVRELEHCCHLGHAQERLMKQAFQVLRLTARTYHKILKVARTIADLDGKEDISEAHLKEAIGYRTMEKTAPNGGRGGFYAL